MLTKARNSLGYHGCQVKAAVEAVAELTQVARSILAWSNEW